MINVMIDIETLGRKPGAMVLSIGAVQFNPRAGLLGETFYEEISIRDSQAYRLKIESDTLCWWLEQSTEAKKVFNGKKTLVETLFKLHRWLPKDAIVWAHGLSFDIPILECLFDRADIELPWNFRFLRDTRTLYDISGKIEGLTMKGEKHHALDDAIYQAECVCEAYKRIQLAGLL